MSSRTRLAKRVIKAFLPIVVLVLVAITAITIWIVNGITRPPHDYGVAIACGLLAPGGINVIFSNIRLAFRSLRQRPGVSAVIIVMLALGIGSTTALFSLFHQILIRPLPVPAPNQLFNLSTPGPKYGSQSCGLAGGCDYVFSYPMFRNLEAKQTAFEGIAAHLQFRRPSQWDVLSARL
jgi:hypothetical protein